MCGWGLDGLASIIKLRHNDGLVMHISGGTKATNDKTLCQPRSCWVIFRVQPSTSRMKTGGVRRHEMDRSILASPLLSSPHAY